jgi:hypothetical protein
MTDTPPQELIDALAPGDRVIWWARGRFVGFLELMSHFVVFSLIFGVSSLVLLIKVDALHDIIGETLKQSGKVGVFFSAILGVVPALVVMLFWSAYLGQRTIYAVTKERLIWLRRHPFHLNRRIAIQEIDDVVLRYDGQKSYGDLEFTWLNFNIRRNELQKAKVGFWGIDAAPHVERFVRELKIVASADGDEKP